MFGELSELAITEDDAQRIESAKLGYNGAVYYKDCYISYIGLWGDPEKIKPLR